MPKKGCFQSMNLSESAETRNKEYRHGLVNAQIEVDLPLQIRALRKQLIGTQSELATLTGMKQARISDMEKPGKVHFTLETLKRLAEAFDVALVVRFAPFSEFLDWSDKFSPDDFRVPSFAEEVQEKVAPEEPEKVAETQPALSLAGLTPSPEDRAQQEEILRTYEFYRGQQGGLTNPYGDICAAGTAELPLRPKGKLFEMKKRSDVTDLKRRQHVKREQRREPRPIRTATAS
jgi:transcriptional regulator with XRE-family HTH domain